jgi:hypothetical protein
LSAIPEPEVESRQAAFDLCRSLLQAERDLPHKEIRRIAAGLGLVVTRSIVQEVQRELHRTVRLEEGPTRSAPQPIRTQTQRPSMTWIVDYVREHPAADVQEVQRAGQTEGYAVHPIAYSTARRIAGLPLRVSSTVERGLLPTPARRDAGAAGGQVSFVDRVVATLRRLERERDELRDAIERILAIVEEHLAE